MLLIYLFNFNSLILLYTQFHREGGGDIGYINPRFDLLMNLFSYFPFSVNIE